MEWIAESNGAWYPPLPAKRKYQPRKKEFVGWGSRKLIDFLESIGKDTSNQISQDDAADIITGYVNEHKLTDPGKKKKVNCDARLQSLFGKKKLVRFSRIKIYTLLLEHYAKEEEASDEDSPQSSQDEDMPAKHPRSVPERKRQIKRVFRTPTSPFVAIVPDNLKLAYLRRSLVQNLLEDFDTFEQKVVGSFVRVKSDPDDYLQKNPYQLLQVTGIKKVSGANVSSEVLLRVPVRNIRVSMLSDDSFTEEECKELSEKIKDGVYKKLTIVDFEERVRVLHEDITKHWLVREIALLQNLIERANEKGWRKELAEYLDRKQLLQTPAEQARMLSEVPKVTPEQIKDDSAVDGFLEDDIDSLYSSESAHGDTPEIAKPDTVSNGAASARVMNFSGHEKQPLENNRSVREGHAGMELNFAEGVEGIADKWQKGSQIIDFSCSGPDRTRLGAGPNGASLGGFAGRVISSAVCWRGAPVQEPQMKQAVEDSVKKREGPASIDLNIEGSAVNTSQVIGFSLGVPEMNNFSPSTNGANALTTAAGGRNSAEHLHGDRAQENRPLHTTNSSKRHSPVTMDLNGVVQGTMEKKVEAIAQVIDLSSDDEDNTVKPPDPPRGNNKSPGFNLGIPVWYYLDPQGYRQGPFSIEMLKLWSDAKYFPPGFKVWMDGQNPSEAALLTDMLRYIFP